MKSTEQRKRARAVLAGILCISPASVFDPLSARVAESVGYEFGLLAGSVATNTTLAAPDMTGILTLTEFADQIRRITRASNLALLVDADNGYGNALNVMRAVQELEHAGVAILCIEDTVLPQPFGQQDGEEKLVAVEEMVGKLRAALAARDDPSLVIVGRTAALRIEGIEGAVARARAYAAAGVDAIFLSGLKAGLKDLGQVEAVHAAAQLPLIVGAAPESFRREDLAARGARFLLQGHHVVAAVGKALRETYTHLINGGAPAALESRIATAKEMGALVNDGAYREWQREYLG